MKKKRNVSEDRETVRYGYRTLITNFKYMETVAFWIVHFWYQSIDKANTSNVRCVEQKLMIQTGSSKEISEIIDSIKEKYGNNTLYFTKLENIPVNGKIIIN